MNIYQPYEELADTQDTLHLKLGDARERILFVVYRAVPIALFLMVWFVLQQGAQKIPMGYNYLYVVLSGIAIVVLFFRSYITEVKITPGNVFMIQKGLTGVKEINVPIQNVDSVSLRVRRGKRGGARFYLHTSTKKRYTMLHIPLLLLNEKNINLIIDTLEHLLKVTVKKI